MADPETVLVEAALAVRERAYAPYSRYFVGAAVRDAVRALAPDDELWHIDVQGMEGEERRDGDKTDRSHRFLSLLGKHLGAGSGDVQWRQCGVRRPRSPSSRPYRERAPRAP